MAMYPCTMIHHTDFKSDNWEATYISIIEEINNDGFCLSSCPPDPEFLNWLKYDKGYSWPGSIRVDIVNVEDLGAVWRIIISSEQQTDEFQHIE